MTPHGKGNGEGNGLLPRLVKDDMESRRGEARSGGCCHYSRPNRRAVIENEELRTERVKERRGVGKEGKPMGNLATKRTWEVDSVKGKRCELTAP